VLFHTNYTIYTLPIFDRVRVNVRVSFSVQIKYSNSMFFKNSLSASWPVRELSSPRLDWPRVGLSASCPVTICDTEKLKTFQLQGGSAPWTPAGGSAPSSIPRDPGQDGTEHALPVDSESCLISPREAVISGFTRTQMSLSKHVRRNIPRLMNKAHEAIMSIRMTFDIRCVPKMTTASRSTDKTALCSSSATV